MSESWLSELALAAGSVLPALVGTAALVRHKARLTGSTLIAPWWWALGSLWAIAGVETALACLSGRDLGIWPQALRYSAAATLFCPLMAALGAKRPQNGPWQFIVFSLWFVLVLPAAEAVVVRSSPAFEVRGLRAWFLLALIGLGVVNSLPTRFWLSALFSATGQTILFLPYLPFSLAGLGRWGTPLALLFCVAGLALAATGPPPRRAALTPLDRLWLDFRDLFGALWSLRVAERVNAAAALYHWEIGLSWGGFHTASGEPIPAELPAELAAAVRQNLENLLRRFVSPEWIDARLGRNVESA
jgi:hypothetical protein